MDISISIDPWLATVIIGTFIALRVWHPITSYAGRVRARQTARKTFP